jgi:hypothetical protein
LLALSSSWHACDWKETSGLLAFRPVSFCSEQCWEHRLHGPSLGPVGGFVYSVGGITEERIRLTDSYLFTWSFWFASCVSGCSSIKLSVVTVEHGLAHSRYDIPVHNTISTPVVAPFLCTKPAITCHTAHLPQNYEQPLQMPHI